MKALLALLVLLAVPTGVLAQEPPQKTRNAERALDGRDQRAMKAEYPRPSKNQSRRAKVAPNTCSTQCQCYRECSTHQNKCTASVFVEGRRMVSLCDECWDCVAFC